MNKKRIRIKKNSGGKNGGTWCKPVPLFHYLEANELKIKEVLTVSLYFAKVFD